MTVALYIRVSTHEQAKEGYSIPAQKERLIAYCTAQGWTDYRFYVDEGVSAKDTNRPELQRMLDDVKKGKINMILVYRLDRFTRRVRDLYEMLEMLDKYKCSFKSATELYDTSNAMGRMFIGLVALLAQWETENLSERVKMALEEKVSGGERVGAVPYGFDLNEKEKLEANVQATTVLLMIDKIKSGMSTNQLADYLNKTNQDRTWHVTGILRILKNPALYGATRWNEEVYEDTHTGIISKQEFMKLQQMLEDRSFQHRRDGHAIYLFQGLLTCPHCGSFLSVNRYIRTRKDGSKYQGVVYKCQVCYKNGDTMLTIGEHRFVEALYDYMKHVEIEDVTPIIEKKDERELLVKQLEKVEKQREKFTLAWSMEKIMDEEYEKLMDETRGIYDELKSKVVQYKTPVPINTEALKDIVFTFNETFTFLEHEERKKFISQFIRKIEFKTLSKPPVNPRNKKGKDLIILTNVEFY
ncbi:recombinase family protein [Bacillus sp. OK048]|uniref:recombinase family protein n=1 Tax=Bacillus sp. OK048 TaxID=1882761 RepID=UPI000884CD57|nr:recombinase family protein [Bacillus sp. OK048]SDM18370.1 Site-specific DNA recombinase [Bacillus sp. OK048]